MVLTKENVIKIFEKNFKYPIVNTPLGKAVKMDAISAFLYANVTGAGYLDNPTFLFSPKGTQKILREAFQYNLVTGIFNGANLYYSPLLLAEKKPYLFQGEKFLVFKDVNKEYKFAEELQDEYDDLLEKRECPTDYVISRIEVTKNGNGMEPFLEYLACEYFKQQGYVVENQIPLQAAVGSPDFGGYLVEGLSSGFYLNELALIRLTKNIKLIDNLKVISMIVGEAKTSTTIMEKQLRKYLDTGLFAKGYEMHPDKEQPSIQSFGLFNIGPKFDIQCQEPRTKYNSPQIDFQKATEYSRWIKNYIKFYLLANFTQEELNAILRIKTNLKTFTADSLISLVDTLSLEETIKKVQEVL